MADTRRRLIFIHGDGRPDFALTAALREQFEVVTVDSIDAARAAVKGHDEAIVLGRADDIPSLRRRRRPPLASTVLQQIGEGAGVVDTKGVIRWANDRLAGADETLRKRFADLCRQAIDLYNAHTDPTWRALHPNLKFSFSTDDAAYELAVSPATVGPAPEHRVSMTAGVLFDITASRRLQSKIDAIDAAGGELMRIDAVLIRRLNAIERLQLLEERIVTSVHDILHFDNFEVRLLDQETNQLELVIAKGLTPLKIGEVMYAEETGHGISGFVAAKGRSYLCNDVERDPRYREGLDDARSSLTVPLHLHDRVIGVFNVESKQPGAFDDNDRQFAEIFGRYIAMAMNILDLLVVERYTTSERAAQNVLDELEEPLTVITSQARTLLDDAPSEEERRRLLEAIHRAASSVASRLRSVTEGPQTILAAEQELRREEPDPSMRERRVLVVDNDPKMLDAIGGLLRQKGCTVVQCGKAIDALQRIEEDAPYDVVISDIKMPDRSGYEVFRLAKARHPPTEVILITGFGYDPSHSIVRATQEGLSSFLFKPFKAAQLLEALSRALHVG